jgi:hypothetical protein
LPFHFTRVPRIFFEFGLRKQGLISLAQDEVKLEISIFREDLFYRLMALERESCLGESCLALAECLLVRQFVEQDARLALEFAQRGYVPENGNLVLEGNSADVLAKLEVKKAFPGSVVSGDLFRECFSVKVL